MFPANRKADSKNIEIFLILFFLLVHPVSRVEYNRRQEDVEKDFRVKSGPGKERNN